MKQSNNATKASQSENMLFTLSNFICEIIKISSSNERQENVKNIVTESILNKNITNIEKTQREIVKSTYNACVLTYAYCEENGFRYIADDGSESEDEAEDEKLDIDDNTEVEDEELDISEEEFCYKEIIERLQIHGQDPKNLTENIIRYCMLVIELICIARKLDKEGSEIYDYEKEILTSDVTEQAIEYIKENICIKTEHYNIHISEAKIERLKIEIEDIKEQKKAESQNTNSETIEDFTKIAANVDKEDQRNSKEEGSEPKPESTSEDSGPKPAGTLGKKNVTITTGNKDDASAENTAMMISTITAILASIFSQSIQKAMFNKILFGKAILFGYAIPAVNLAFASFIFGLLAFCTVFAILFTAKLVQDPKKSLFHGTISEFNNKESSKILKPAILAGICILIINAYAVPLQTLFFNTIILGGTAAANLSFAVISTIVIGLILYGLTSIGTSSKDKNNKKEGGKISFLRIAALFSFLIGTAIANPIAQTLFGISISGGPWLVVFSSLLVGAASSTIIAFIIAAGKVAQKKQYGFSLVIYAVSFLMLTIYASPIQIAILGHSLMLITPAFSNISFGAIASIVTTPIITKIYKDIETKITPNLIREGQISKSVSDFCTSLVGELNKAIYNTDDSPEKTPRSNSEVGSVTSSGVKRLFSPSSSYKK